MLDQLLTTLDVGIEAFAICETCPGWRMSFGPDKNSSIHYVLCGSGSITISDLAPIALSPDSLVILPRGAPHSFENASGGTSQLLDPPPAEGGAAALRTIRAGQPVQGRDCLVVACGTIRASFGGSLGLFDRLQHPLVEGFGTNPLGVRFQALLDELRTPSFGTRALTESFLKQAVVLVLRRQFKRENGWPFWLDAYRDPSLARAVSAMLERPSRSFTLDELALMAGVSRSVFAERFTAAFGHPPIEFLKRVRLQRAARLLEMTVLPVKIIAKTVGYESRSYFSRAFRAAFGIDPTDYRARQHLGMPDPGRAPGRSSQPSVGG